jgi:hypothetical protein
MRDCNAGSVSEACVAIASCILEVQGDECIGGAVSFAASLEEIDVAVYIYGGVRCRLSLEALEDSGSSHSSHEWDA